MTEIQPKYILTQDTFSLFSKIERAGLGENQQFASAAQDYFAVLDATISQTFPANNVVCYAENEMDRRLSGRITDIYQSDPDAFCICLDRCLLDNIENDPIYADKFFRFSICRTADGERVPRQGGDSFADQLKRLKSLVPDIEKKKITVVDDGFFSGGTIREFVDIATKNGIRLPVDRVIGFIGSDAATELPDSFPSVEILEPIENLYEWVDIRDFSPMGGKKFEASRTNRVSSSIPYLYPWSEGDGASLNFSPNFFTASATMIRAFKDLVTAYQQSTGGKQLTFRELVRSGFPLPTNTGKTIPVSINDTVCDYLDRCQFLLKAEQERQVVVFDMDGTLYQLDGAGRGFSGSTLEATVLKNARKFIQAKENCSTTTALAIRREGLKNPVGLSVFLSQRYGISRDDYFDTVWNIDPGDIVKNYETAVTSVRRLMEKFPDKKLILLTSAPRIWARNVLSFLNVGDCFETVYTGEQYKTKQEIFSMLAGRYVPGNITSIGDQWETDILPAQAFGISGIKINQPGDLLTLPDQYS